MNRWTRIALAACVLAAGCGDNAATGPSSLPPVFIANLSPANEVPPVNNAEAGGRGVAQVQLNVTRDAANVVTGGTATFYFQLSGFPDGTTVVGAHIHPAPAGVNGPVLVNTGVSATAPVVVSGGLAEFRTGAVTVDAATAQAMINNPAGFYFNVHSPLNSGGFARGQLTRIQ